MLLLNNVPELNRLGCHEAFIISNHHLYVVCVGLLCAFVFYRIFYGSPHSLLDHLLSRFPFIEGGSDTLFSTNPVEVVSKNYGLDESLLLFCTYTSAIGCTLSPQKIRFSLNICTNLKSACSWNGKSLCCSRYFHCVIVNTRIYTYNMVLNSQSHSMYNHVPLGTRYWQLLNCYLVSSKWMHIHYVKIVLT